MLTTNVIDYTVASSAQYDILLSPPLNLAGSTITVRVYVASSFKPVTIGVHYDDTTDSSSAGTTRSTTVPASGWFEAHIDVSDSGPSVDNVDLIGIGLDDFEGNGTNIIYLDSITISPAAVGPWEFTSSASPLQYTLYDPYEENGMSGAIAWRSD